MTSFIRSSAITRSRGGCLVAFLDEAVQHDNTLADKRAEEDSRNALCPFEPQFEKAFTKRLGMRLAKVGPERKHSSREHDVSCGQAVWQSQDFFLRALAVLGDRVFHGHSITNVLFFA